MDIKQFSTLNDEKIIKRMLNDPKLVITVFSYAYSKDNPSIVIDKALRIRRKYLSRSKQTKQTKLHSSDTYYFKKKNLKQVISKNTPDELGQLMLTSKSVFKLVNNELKSKDIEMGLKLLYLEAYIKYLKNNYESTFHAPYNKV